MGTIGTSTGTYLAAEAAPNEVEVHSSSHQEGGNGHYWYLPVQVPTLLRRRHPMRWKCTAPATRRGGMGTIGTFQYRYLPCCAGGTQ